jgi:hypothetical protein
VLRRTKRREGLPLFSPVTFQFDDRLAPTHATESALLTKLQFLPMPRFRQTSERKYRTRLIGDPPSATY